MRIVPTRAVPSQRLTVQLANQSCMVLLDQKTDGLFINLFVNDILIIGGVICQNLNRVVRDSYLGFIGDLIFIDSQGSSDPEYTGLGSRYNLAYLEVTDL